MLIFELLDDHCEALREKGKIDELHREVEKMRAAGEAGIGQISRLQANLDHKAVVHSSREELELLRGVKDKGDLAGSTVRGSGELEKKGSKMQDSELQQKELALQTV